jgi:hypothetical protein
MEKCPKKTVHKVFSVIRRFSDKNKTRKSTICYAVSSAIPVFSRFFVEGGNLKGAGENQPQRQKPLAAGVFIAVFTPFLVRLKQFTGADRRGGVLNAALFDKRPDNVHLTPVFLGRAGDRRGRNKPVFKPSPRSLNHPVQYARSLGKQFFLKAFVLLFRGNRRGKRYQLNPSPDTVIGASNHRLVVGNVVAPTWSQQSENKNLERRFEIKILPVQKPRRKIVISRNLFD